MKNTPYFERTPFFFDQNHFRMRLADGKAIAIFKDALHAAKVNFDRRFREGEDIRTLVYEQAHFVDFLLHYAWHQFHWQGSVCLIAVGGYGRGELHPASDIDLLFLHQEQLPQADLEAIEGFFTFLWDIGLDIGHSVRTLAQCVEIAAQDITVATNILESRTLMGDGQLRDELLALTGPDKIWPPDAFFKAKFQEQQERHAKHDNSSNNLEPNVKNAPGGLRDIQMIGWVAKRFFNVRTIRQLEGRGFFTEEEFAILLTGEEFLWRVRYGLHMLAKRGEERLLFDHQRELATLFGYKDTPERLAIEQFMHRYYRIVQALQELNDVLLQFLSEAILQAGQQQNVEPINARFQLRNGFIEAAYTRVFEDDPSALLEIFVLMGKDKRILGVRASTIRLIRECRHLIDDEFRKDPDNTALFMDLMRSPYSLVRQLKRMKRYGILGRYLPEFDRITGQMQHDLFHIYTVDEHTLLVMKNMRRFRLPYAQEKYPVAHHIMKRLEKPELLYIAGLFHDIAKGRGGDHSMLGKVDAEAFCERHGLTGRETRLVSWLVEMHLLMSAVSQKQDISDPDVIHKFALLVGDQLRLDYLYLLTVADINGTNPDLWNTWRASLMRQLYLETKRALRRGLENPIDRQDIILETQQAAIRKLEDKNFSESRIRTLWGDMGDDYFLRESHLDIAWHTEAIACHRSDEPLVLIRQSRFNGMEGATQIFVRTKDRDNVFAAAANALSGLDLDIQDARLYSSPDGYTIDTFFVLDENGEPTHHDRFDIIRRTLHDELSLVDKYPDIIQRRTPRVLKHFAMPSRTMISNDLLAGTTVLEVISPDRPGLLAAIGRVFLSFGIQLQNAKIATLGERVEDIFFITDSEGQPLSDAAQCEALQVSICKALDDIVGQHS
ncbi:[protein-PII] uridylyltransferase [Simiduia aestuariiviva]|uniref:Bifunctional uridylyltransferase/uridylyl-removing enzyme n=1 Tax=Simiduia aestuariiviva TaxID=1510459 RepID=A0A839UR44_9GAMM|nr:[protein-PII] uridylyltransferase [Simiduia aestuariiviva]